jgi:hypothetical protein
MMHAFSGYLRVQQVWRGCPTGVALFDSGASTQLQRPLPAFQVLLLWDRILGFDSLQVLPLLAATIFAFRKQTLMQVRVSVGPACGRGPWPLAFSG